MTSKLKEETEQKIIKAATNVFIKHGSSGARMQEIADKAGVNKALLHYYFRSKRKLFDKILEHVLHEIAETVILSSQNTDNLQDFLKSFIHLHLRLVKKNHPLIAFMMTEMRNDPTKVASLFKKQFVNFEFSPLHLVNDLLSEAVAHGYIQPTDPKHFLINLLSMDVFYFVISPLIKELFDLSDAEHEKLTAEREEIIFNYLWAYLTRSEEKP